MSQLKVFVTVLLCICYLSPVLAKTEEAKSSRVPQRFSKGTVIIGTHMIDVELAKTTEEHAQGLMHRTSLGEISGMLFIFDRPRILSFWMKNTFIPLSIAYIDENKKIIDIQDMSPVKSVMDQNTPSYVSKGPALYALEVNQGFFKKRKIKVGDTVKIVETKVQN